MRKKEVQRNAFYKFLTDNKISIPTLSVKTRIPTYRLYYLTTQTGYRARIYVHECKALAINLGLSEEALMTFFE